MAFQTYILPDFTDPCPCCHSEEDEALIRSKPLRELGEPELISFAFDALLTWGDSRVFRHFLPRLFELMTIPYGPDYFAIDPEILVSKLRHEKWREWPTVEQAAVGTFLHALWHARLGDMERAELADQSDTWLCTIAQAEDTLAPYLAQWQLDDRQTAIDALSAFILTTSIVESGGEDRDTFWADRENQYAELQSWVRSAEVKAVLYQALISSTDERRAEFQAAISTLSY